MGGGPLGVLRWRRAVQPAPPQAPRPRTEVDTDVRRAVTRTTGRTTAPRPPIPAEIDAVGTLLERAARHRWSTPVLVDALLRGPWPPLAPGTQPVAPDLPARHSPAWRRALIAELEPTWARYLDLRSGLVTRHGPAPFGDAHCARCTPSQTCDRCLAALRAAWDLRDAAARAVLAVPAAAAVAATTAARPAPRPRTNPTRRRSR